MTQIESITPVLQWTGYILAAVACLMLMIIVHEFGHYLAGKLFKFKILEFSVGFGPKIFTKVNKKNGEKFSVRWLPLGGFCQFKDEDGKEGTKDGDEFNSKPVWQRIIVLFAGAFFNLIFSMIIASIFFMSFGDYNLNISNVSNNFVDSQYVSPFQEGDEIRSINGVNAYGVLDVTKNPLQEIAANDENTFIIVRDGKELTLTIKKSDFYILDEDGNVTQEVGHGYGIILNPYKQDSFFRAIGKGIQFPFKVTYYTFKVIGQMFGGDIKPSEALGGTITAVSTIATGVSYGFRMVMYIVCVLSASIGIMNLLPIPALDGGRIVFCIIEGIRRKPIDRKIEGIINTVGLFALFALAIILDLLHFIG